MAEFDEHYVSRRESRIRYSAAGDRRGVLRSAERPGDSAPVLRAATASASPRVARSHDNESD